MSASSMSQELENILERYHNFRALLPNSWSAFFARFGNLRPIQTAAIPPILDGSDVLAMAPTAGGKTEAVAAPVCERLVTERWQGLSTVIVTPTRALVNDLFVRLRQPCMEMCLRLGRKTADHGMRKGEYPQILITTPESLESLLTFRREQIADLRALIMDEIHLLDGGPRGDQLRLIIGRLKRYLRYLHPEDPVGLQCIASSATVSDPERVASRYLGIDRQIVAIAGNRDIESRIVSCGGDDQDRAEAAIIAAETFPNVQKILVFVNSRKQVDCGAQFFKYSTFADTPVYSHHGSLSTNEREETEARFKQDSQAICVATMTLEVGIDIGDVDLVICVDPPFSLSSFLQRIGRGCRRMQGKTRVVCLARDRASELLFEGLVNQARLGMPEGPMAPARRSVILQQLLAYLRQVDQHRRTMRQFQQVFGSPVPPAITESVLGEVARDATLTELLAERHGIYEPASSGWDFIESSRIYSNIESPMQEVALVDVDTGNPVAYVREVASEGVQIAGKSFDVLSGGNSARRYVRRRDGVGDAPGYHTRNLPYASDIGVAVANVLGIRESEVICIKLKDCILVMTWLGKLCNSALAVHLKEKGYLRAASAFALTIERCQPDEVIKLLRSTVSAICGTNPLASTKVENIADLGPYFGDLSETQQRCARMDWLDGEFLSSWVSRHTDLRVVDSNSELAADLLELAKM